jgi:hypothetical protein
MHLVKKNKKFSIFSVSMKESSKERKKVVKKEREALDVKKQKAYVLGWGEVEKRWAYCRYLWEGHMVL